MEKQTVIFNTSEEKKHSVRYTNQASKVVTDIYILKSALGSSVPLAIKVTIEEA